MHPWQVGLPWDGCGGKLEHQEYGKKKGKCQRKEVRSWISLMLLALHLLLLSGGQWLLLGQKEDVFLDVGALCIHKVLRVASLWSGTHVRAALLAHRAGVPSGWGSRGASPGTQGKSGGHRCPWINSKRPGRCRGLRPRLSPWDVQRCGGPGCSALSVPWYPLVR